jgi:hypothetical protein
MIGFRTITTKSNNDWRSDAAGDDQKAVWKGTWMERQKSEDVSLLFSATLFPGFTTIYINYTAYIEADFTRNIGRKDIIQ